MKNLTSSKLYFILFLISVALPTKSAIIEVEFLNSQGPFWTGFVDTETDILTINSWIENKGGKEQYWTPVDFPLIFLAYEAPKAGVFKFSELKKYDVSDDWDGVISSTWGFLSILKKSDIDWNEGTFVGNDSRLGWGIAQNNYGMIDTSDYNNEEFFSFLPYSSTENRRVQAGIIPEPVIVTSPITATLFIFVFVLLAISRKFKQLS